MIYMPLCLFVLLFVKIKKYDRGDLERLRFEESFGFLLLLWYSPLLQSIGKMFACYEDVDLGWVLTADVAVSCEASTLRTLTVMHAVIMCAFIGFGLPGEEEKRTERGREGSYFGDFLHFATPL